MFCDVNKILSLQNQPPPRNRGITTVGIDQWKAPCGVSITISLIVLKLNI